VTIADSEWDDRNPSLGRSRDGRLVLGYHHQGNYDGEGNLKRGKRVDTLVKQSEDGGRTWGDPFELGYEELRGRSPYGRMVNVGSTLLMPIYGARIGSPKNQWSESSSYVLRSTDSGRTWGDPTEVAMNMNEASYLVLPDGELLGLLRSETDHPASVYTTRSEDDGYCWTDPVRVTQDSEHPADGILLSNGWVLLVYGHRHVPFGVQGMVSTDYGRSWQTDHKLVFADDRPGGDCGYPSVTMFSGGRLVVIYYSAGDQMDSRRLDGSYSRAVLFDEDELVSVLERRGLD
jgi:hypothetical protein